MFKKKYIFSIALASTLAFSSIVPANLATAQVITEGSVTSHSLTVRTGPSASHSAQAWLKQGDQVTVLKDHGSFLYVQYGNKKGYVHKGYIKQTSKNVSPSTPKTPTNTTTTPTASSNQVGTVTAANLTVRSGPSASHKAIDWLKKGAKVTVLKNEGAFSHVQYGNKKGYVHNGYLKLTTTTTNTPPASSKGSTHVVQKGETLWKISTMYNTTVANIQSLNNLQSTVIKVGQQLKVNGTAQTTKPSTSKPASGSLKGKIIVLDAGHGGKFAGAQGFVHEEDVNLQIALKTRDELQRLGATVIMTRTTDTHLSSVYNNDLAARPAVAKRNGAHMFISIHANAGVSTANGTEVYWYSSGRGDQKLATNMVKTIANEAGLRNRGAKNGNFSVIRNSGNNIPSVLIETGFVSNQNDAAILGSASGQTKISAGIAKGILKYYGK